MFQIEVTDRWHTTFPGSHIGVLLIGNVDNSRRITPLDQRKREIETRLRQQFAGFSRADLMKLEVLQAYRSYYKKFGKTYHVQLQLESVVQQGKPLPSVSPLVDANFAAELETLILTAGHDADLLESPVTIDATQGGELFRQINGLVQSLKSNDMMMSDSKGIVCTILYGQDVRTSISPNTCRALYVAYAPSGVLKTMVQQQLDSIHENILLVAPEAEIEMVEVFAAK
ncbi:MAG: phenylalanine--tRNA ligase beta subunit-related protein [Acidobacteriota bacterium]